MKTPLLLLLLNLSCLLVTYAQSPAYKPAYVLGNTLNDPHDILISDEGLIYVADSYVTRIFDSSGNFKNEINLYGIYLQR